MRGSVVIGVIVCGIGGRMGGRLARLVLESEDLELAGGTEHSVSHFIKRKSS